MTYAFLVRGAGEKDRAQFDYELEKTAVQARADRRLKLIQAGGEIG